MKTIKIIVQLFSIIIGVLVGALTLYTLLAQNDSTLYIYSMATVTLSIIYLRGDVSALLKPNKKYNNRHALKNSTEFKNRF